MNADSTQREEENGFARYVHEEHQKTGQYQKEGFSYCELRFPLGLHEQKHHKKERLDKDGQRQDNPQKREQDLRCENWSAEVQEPDQEGTAKKRRERADEICFNKFSRRLPFPHVRP